MDFPIVEITPVLLFRILLNFLSVKLGSSFLGIKDVKVDLVGKPHA